MSSPGRITDDFGSLTNPTSAAKADRGRLRRVRLQPELARRRTERCVVNQSALQAADSPDVRPAVTEFKLAQVPEPAYSSEVKADHQADRDEDQHQDGRGGDVTVAHP